MSTIEGPRCVGGLSRGEHMSLRVLLISIVVACGGDGVNQAPADALTDAVSTACTAQATYPNFGSNSRGYARDDPALGSTAHTQVVVQTLNLTDVMFVQLEAGFGGFGSGEITPGTYPLRGDDLDPSRCGICAYVWPQALNGTSLDAVNAAYLMNQRYLAVAGTITLTAAGGSATGSNAIAGSVSNLAFKHVIIEPDGSFQDAADQCTTSIGSGGFGPYTLAVGSGSGSAH